MQNHLIIGVHLTNRFKQALEVQSLFTKYGCNIKTRIGLHDVMKDACSPSGIVVLEMFGEETPCMEFMAKLKAIEGVDVQSMKFTH